MRQMLILHKFYRSLYSLSTWVKQIFFWLSPTKVTKSKPKIGKIFGTSSNFCLPWPHTCHTAWEKFIIWGKCGGLAQWEMEARLFLHTLSYLINVGPRLLFSNNLPSLHIWITPSTFILFTKFCQPPRLFHTPRL